MQVTQAAFPSGAFEAPALERLAHARSDCALVFGAAELFADPRRLGPLSEALGGVPLIGCSTAGEIVANGVSDGGLTVSAMRFERASAVQVRHAEISDLEDSDAAGERLGAALAGNGLHAVLVFGPGVQVNGSALIAGMSRVLGPEVAISGGLAADGGAFLQTWTVANARVSDRGVVALGIYDASIRIHHGSYGGWRPFGPLRKVTRSRGSMLYELDGAPALEVYKRYLGDYAAGLPGSGLLFPFAMHSHARDRLGIVRTILGIDEAVGSVLLAGAVDEGNYLQLMHADTDALVEGATRAAEQARDGLEQGAGGLALLVSCVGRKLAMAGRVDEEIEAVADTLGKGFAVTGFYSNGEISPDQPGAACHLHNQTMTITLITEQ